MAKQIEDSRVFTATVDLLLTNGYVGTTTKLIAEQAGINEVTLFRKYGSKAGLVSAALMHERKTFTARPITYTGNLAADLLQMARLYSDASTRQSRLMLLIIAEAVRHDELREAIHVPFMLISHFGDIIARYQSEGKMRPGNPLLIVSALLGPLIINTLLRMADSDLPLPVIDLRAHVENFLRGYKL